MRIGLIGGTGKEGRGLAMRWARAGHDVFVGSRDAERGAASAAELSERSGATLAGGDNAAACAHGEVVCLCVPYSAHRPTLTSLRDALQGRLLIDITVPLVPPKVRRVHLPEGGAAALEAQAILGEDVRVVATLHHVSSVHLSDLEQPLHGDILLCGDGPANREIVAGLLRDLGGNPVDAGVLANAVALESITPVLLHINKHYGSPGSGIAITNLPNPAGAVS